MSTFRPAHPRLEMKKSATWQCHNARVRAGAYARAHTHTHANRTKSLLSVPKRPGKGQPTKTENLATTAPDSHTSQKTNHEQTNGCGWTPPLAPSLDSLHQAVTRHVTGCSDSRAGSRDCHFSGLVTNPTHLRAAVEVTQGARTPAPRGSQFCSCNSYENLSKISCRYRQDYSGIC